MPKQSSDPSNAPRPPAPSGGDSPLKNLLLGLFLCAIGALLLATSRRPKGLAVGVIGVIVGPILVIMGIVGLAKGKK